MSKKEEKRARLRQLRSLSVPELVNWLTFLTSPYGSNLANVGALPHPEGDNVCDCRILSGLFVKLSLGFGELVASSPAHAGHELIMEGRHREGRDATKQFDLFLKTGNVNCFNDAGRMWSTDTIVEVAKRNGSVPKNCRRLASWSHAFLADGHTARSMQAEMELSVFLVCIVSVFPPQGEGERPRVSLVRNLTPRETKSCSTLCVKYYAGEQPKTAEGLAAWKWLRVSRSVGPVAIDPQNFSICCQVKSRSSWPQSSEKVFCLGRCEELSAAAVAEQPILVRRKHGVVPRERGARGGASGVRRGPRLDAAPSQEPLPRFLC